MVDHVDADLAEDSRRSSPLTPERIHDAKRRAWRSAPGGPFPSNVEWIASLPTAERQEYEGVVRRKPSRSLSGVAIVAVMTAPARCPHGRCTYCPGGVDLGSPQSYTGEEPSAMRGAQFQYDSRKITENRLATLEALGHPTSKVEAIVMGGTFPSRPKPYRDQVVRGIFDGLNGVESSSLADAQVRNESAGRRLVSLTVETRPDWCDGRILPDLLTEGVTRVEVGVECLHDDVLTSVNRQHDADDVTTATREAKDRGLKVAYHLMLGLPGMDPGKDLEDFVRLFDEPAFRPDMLKIYPTLVLPGTPLYDDWTAGRYHPYDLETTVDLLARMKSVVPPWVRIQRIQRDIPSRLLADGVRASNVRQLAVQRLHSWGRTCSCLRCREAGRRASPPSTAFTLRERSYTASGGEERFLSFEDDATQTVAAFLRLRLPSSETFGGLDAPVIRELKVLGAEVALGAEPTGRDAYQHRGFGRALVNRAESVARETHDGLYVLSAVGTRPYYAKLGYRPQGAHMWKPLSAWAAA